MTFSVEFMGRKKSTPRDRTNIQVPVTADEKARIQAAANARRVPMSTFIRECVLGWLAKRGE